MIRRERSPAPEGLTASAGPALERLEEYNKRSQREKAQRRWPFEHDVVQTAEVVQDRLDPPVRLSRAFKEFEAWWEGRQALA